MDEIDQDRERAMLNILRRRGGNGRDETVTGLSATTERRLFAGARLAYWIVAVLVTAALSVGGAVVRYDRQQTKTAEKVEQHDAELKKLEDDKQSKEGAAANRELIIEKLEQLDKRWAQRFDEFSKRLDQLERRRR